MPVTLPYSPEEVRQILAHRQRQEEARRQHEVELDAQVTSIEDSRRELDIKIQEYLQKCDQLRQASRRVASEESSLRYLTFANMQLRMGGAMTQALKRAEGGTRLLRATKVRQEEDAKRAEQERVQREVRASEKQVRHSLLPSHDDFESLYGDNYDVEDLINA